MAGNRFTGAERDTIARLHGEGLSARAIGRDLGRPPQSVSRIAAQLGLRFDREKTRAAHSARVADMRAARSQVAAELLDKARSLLGKLDRPYVDHAFAPGGAPEDRYSEHLAMPTPADQAALMRAASTALTAHCKLAGFDADDTDSLSDVDQWLAAMTGGDGSA